MSPFERLRGAHLTSHPAIEDFILSMLSLMVIAVAIMAITGQQAPKIAVAAQPAATGAPKDVINVYGTLVDVAGNPIPNATVEILKAGSIKATTVTSASGAWSTTFIDKTRNFTIRVTVVNNGQTYTATYPITMDPGMTWGIQIVFSQSSNWVFVPLPGY